jgi:GNAT superfamily N-acetyltransferase
MVTRQPIDVRRAGTGDVEDLLQLWSVAREDFGPLGRPTIVTAPEQIRPRLRAALLGDDVHVVIARWDGRPAGYTLVRVVPIAALLDGLAVQIEQLYVLPELRRHGVARAMLVAVTGIAERVGAEQVISSAPQGARDSHRFLARLGFSPVVVRRVAATSVLRRKLAGEGRRGGLEDLLSRRRSLRARAGWPRRGESVTLTAGEDADFRDDAADLVADSAGEFVPSDETPTVEVPAAALEAVGPVEPQPDGDPAPAPPGTAASTRRGEPVRLAVGHEAVAGASTSTA